MNSVRATGLRLAGRIASQIVAALLAVSCTSSPPPLVDPPSNDEFSVMSYNVRLYAFLDRDDDGQADDFKPDREINALVSLVTECRPDVLAIQEMGDRAALEDFRRRLAAAGLEYPHTDYVGNREGSFANLSILSRFPIESPLPVTNLEYSIKGETFPVQRGFQQVDLRVNENTTFRLINVHLKSKLFHEAGQTEMRRNEARLLATHVRRQSRDASGIPMLVCGDFNDSIRSAALREILENGATDLKDLFLKDPQQDLWTHFHRYEQAYARIDYMLANPAMMARWNREKSELVRDPRTYEASDHRPLYAVFKVSGNPQ